MKIAFLNIYSGLVDRGAETFVRELSARLDANHKKVVVISGKRIPPKRWPFLWRFFIDPNGLSVFLFTLKNIPYLFRERFDVVIPLNGGWQPAIVRLITRIYGGKMIISGQSGRGWDDIVNLWSFPDIFAPISTSAKKWALCINPLVKVEYIPNGVDLTKFIHNGKRLALKLKHPIVLYVGALEPGKRVLETIKAVARLKDVSLLVVGDGELKGEAERLGKQLLGERFEVMRVSYDDLPKIYRTANVFTIPSKSHYSFEIVLVEAMATNLPVVANNDPIRREIVGDAGIFVDPENTQEYASALEKALDKDWGDKPRKQAEKFSWDIIAEEYDKLFRQLVSSD